jgi:hypothetical protein
MTHRYAYWITAAAVLVALAIAALWTTTLNHDVAWYLHMVDVARRGGRLYRDVIDTNPPLIIFLLWPAAWLSSLARISEPNAVRLYECAMALGSLVASARLAMRAWPRASREAIGMIGLTIAFVLFPFLRYDFGQREHFAVMLTLPYILLAAMPASGVPSARVRMLIGLAAGLGFSIKPHFAAAWAGIEAWLLFTARQERPWRRPELAAALAAAAGYLICLVIWIPDYFDVAREVIAVYASQQAGLRVLLSIPDLVVWATAAALLAVIKLAPDTRRPVAVLFLAATGYLVAALAQGRGWSYHLYPARAFMALFFVTFALALFETVPGLLGAIRGGLSNAALLLSAALVSLGVRYATVERIPRTPDLVPPLIEIVNRERPAGPLASLSMRTVIYPAFPVVNETHATWPMRHNGLWFLPGLYEHELLMPQAETRFRAPENMGPIERKFFEEIVTDLCAAPPGILLVEPPVAGAPEGRRTLDLVAYYQQDARFRRLFDAYTPLTRLGTFIVYIGRAGASCRVP